MDAATQNVFPLFSRDVVVVITQNALCVLEGRMDIATQNAPVCVFPKAEWRLIPRILCILSVLMRRRMRYPDSREDFLEYFTC